MRLVALLAAALTLPAPAHAASWSGSFRLPAGAAPVALDVRLDAGHATVSLGPGHAGPTRVVAKTVGGMRFALPGGVVFDGRRSGRAISGTVRQGSLRGTFSLAPGASGVPRALGLYRAADGSAAAIVQAAGLPTWLVELPSGHVHGLGAGLTTVGARLGATSGDGTLRVEPERLTWRRAGAATSYARVALRQREVRVGAIAATLTLPPGRGPFPAVVMAHGSGPNGRDEFQVFAAVCELLGIAVLADDKRGVGQSGGRYPGEQATPAAIDVLARDAQAEARYLARLPEIDPRRVGILGDSQAGWIIALAAAREPLLHWAVPLVGPTVTVDESDAWGALAGRGQSPPSGTTAQMLARVRAQGPGGFDPAPWLRRLTIPVFWVFADDDRNVPTQLCVERLERLRQGHEFSWTVVHATHTLFDLPGGLNASLLLTRGFAEGLWPAVSVWLRAHVT